MSWLSLTELAAMSQGYLVCGSADAQSFDNVMVESVSTDSRKVAVNELFIALKGERFDAHDFIEALAGQVAAVMVDHELDIDLPQIVVDDTLVALGYLAREWRKKITHPVLGLTGSNGKTTVKEMTAAILSQKGQVLSTVGNLNNNIGMPLTILNIRQHHDYSVIEMGANHFNEIAYLVGISQPDVALINNAGKAHLDGFGDLDGVARAKGELYVGLAEGAKAIVNNDDDYADYWKTLIAPQNVVSFAMTQQADIQGRYQIHLGQVKLTIQAKGDSVSINLPLLGKHNAMNALAAASLSLAIGVTLSQVKAGLESMKPVQGRLAESKGRYGCRLIDDTYNANPSSAKVSIDVLASFNGYRILVLGDMGELGQNALSLYAEVSDYVALTDIDCVYSLGEQSGSVTQALGTRGRHFSHFDELMIALDQQLQQLNDTATPVTLLVKGSRFMKMERVINTLEAVAA